MIISRISGGLGNQMFQYAFGRELALRHNTELKLDLGVYTDPKQREEPPRSFDLDIFNISADVASDEEIFRLAKRVRNRFADRVLNRLLGVKKGHLRESHFHFSEAAYNAPDGVYLSGYWQSPKYFRGAEELLRREFTVRDAIIENAGPIFNNIARTNSVCVHVRRGDFVVNPLNGLYGVDYYKKAEELILERVTDPHYFVFSDDIEWCRSNLSFAGPTRFVDDDFGPRKFRDDLRLMSACKHFVIANSSFSWWAAWLNPDNGKTVVAPAEWFRDPTLDTKDLIPKEWLRI
jgi:hypothetical protein